MAGADGITFGFGCTAFGFDSSAFGLNTAEFGSDRISFPFSPVAARVIDFPRGAGTRVAGALLSGAFFLGIDLDSLLQIQRTARFFGEIVPSAPYYHRSPFTTMI
jgi:hypothetical protein